MGESSDQVLLHCFFITWIWTDWSGSLVWAGRLLRTAIHCSGRGADKRANKLWNCAVLASLLVVCSERYRTIIDDKEEGSSLCDKIKFMFHWVSMSRHFKACSFGLMTLILLDCSVFVG